MRSKNETIEILNEIRTHLIANEPSTRNKTEHRISLFKELADRYDLKYDLDNHSHLSVFSIIDKPRLKKLEISMNCGYGKYYYAPCFRL